jgi:hypothetical protein
MRKLRAAWVVHGSVGLALENEQLVPQSEDLGVVLIAASEHLAKYRQWRMTMSATEGPVDRQSLHSSSVCSGDTARR